MFYPRAGGKLAENGVANAKQRFRRLFLCSESWQVGRCVAGGFRGSASPFGFVYANKVRDKLLFCLNFVAASSSGLLQLPRLAVAVLAL